MVEVTAWSHGAATAASRPAFTACQSPSLGLRRLTVGMRFGHVVDREDPFTFRRDRGDGITARVISLTRDKRL